METWEIRTLTIVLNWTEKLAAAKLVKVAASVGVVNAGVEVTTAPQFAMSLGVIAREARGGRRGVAAPAGVDVGSEEARGAHAHSHSHSHSHMHGANAGGASSRHRHPFASATMPLPTVVDRDAFLEFVRQLPESIVRAKGMVRFADRDQEMFVWNRIGGRKNVLLDVSRPHALAQPVALFIGADLPVEELSRSVAKLHRR